MNGREISGRRPRLITLVCCCFLLAANAGGVERAAKSAAALTVTTHAGPHGSITPQSATVARGERASFTILPEEGYAAMVSGCGGTASGTTYTTAPVSRPCRIKATFLRIIPPNKEM